MLLLTIYYSIIYLFQGFQSKLSDIFIEKMGYIIPTNDNTQNTNINVGNTFACKFSRNKNNLHIVGVSTEHGEIIVQNTVSHYNDQNNQFKRSKFNNQLST